MDSTYFINLVVIFILNAIFFVSGVCLNTTVIISFWRSTQLRKKLCYFMIMVLSCCDLVAVLTNNPLTAFAAMLWLTGTLDLDSIFPGITLWYTNIFFAFSLLALLVMNFDRYLATSYPIFHRTSVTRGRLLLLLTILVIIEGTLAAMSVGNNPVISYQMHILIVFILLTPPMLFFNYKLFLVVRRSRGGKRMTPEIKTTSSLKHVSSCLLAVACFVMLSTPIFVYIGLMMNSANTASPLDITELVGMWAETMTSMNCTFNCLIFYWKNKTLRAEGLKVMKSIKMWRLVQS